MSNTVSSNRRGSHRRTPKKSSTVLCVSGRYGLGPNVAVALLDVSEYGIRLVLKEPLATGHSVSVNLASIAERRPTSISGEVMWCVPMVDGQYCLGVRFHHR